jgi:Heterokaryon incompatibility protein (HET)
MPGSWVRIPRKSQGSLKLRTGRLELPPWQDLTPDLSLAIISSSDIFPAPVFMPPDCYLIPWILSCSHPATKTPLRRRAKAEVIDGELNVEQIKSWIRQCTSLHKICGPTFPTAHLDNNLQLNLIDVESCCIVSAQPGSIHIALSYVWGLLGDAEAKQRTAARDDATTFSPNIPVRGQQNASDNPCQTVRDAMTLVKQLDMRYLWVDAHCIGPSKRQRDIHIGQMDRIYEGAFLTIFALSGATANSGLLRLSIPLQVTPQHCVDLDIGRAVATRLPNFMDDTDSSRWNRRAWTMQEATLSSQHLCFTEQSLYWVCKEGEFHDVIELGESRAASVVLQDQPPSSLSRFPFDLGAVKIHWGMREFTGIWIQDDFCHRP